MLLCSPSQVKTESDPGFIPVGMSFASNGNMAEGGGKSAGDGDDVTCLGVTQIGGDCSVEDKVWLGFLYLVSAISSLSVRIIFYLRLMPFTTAVKDVCHGHRDWSYKPNKNVLKLLELLSP